MIPSLQVGQFGRHIQGVVASAGDPHYVNVKTYLRFDDADGTTAPLCQKGKTWMRFADAVVSTASPLVGSGSGVFDGVGDGFATNDNVADFDIGSGDFTIEITWSLAAALSIGQFAMLVARYNTAGGGIKSFEMGLHNNGGTYRFELYGSSNGTADDGSWLFPLGFTPATDTAYTLALSRNTSNLRAFIDGVQIGTTQSIGGYSFHSHGAGGSELSLGTVIGGGTPPALFPFNGKMDEFRYTVGVGRYTAGYTVSLPYPNS